MPDDCDGLANAAQLFSPGELKRRFKTLSLPTSGLKVRIRSLSERELSHYQTATVANRGVGLKRSRLEDANRRLIALVLVDAAGNRLLSDSQVGKLAEWDSADSSFLYDEAAAHVGIKEGEIEDLVKNSERITVDDSPCDSPVGAD